jgi:GT2 family glycosyltransferase
MHLGATRAMNIGTRTAKADLVFYLSPNVEVAPDTVIKLAERLESDPEIAAVCPLLTNPDGQVVSRDHRIRALIAGQDSAVEIDPARDTVEMEHPGLDALMSKKQFIKSMNYFDERYGHSWSDADMAMQVRRAQKKIKLYPSIKATYCAAPDPNAGDPLFQADRTLGAAAFLGKYDGFFAGLMFRIGAIFRALGRFDLRQIGPLMSGQKLDGSQAM